MFNNILESIKKFFREVLKDIKKIKFSSIFSDTRLLVICILVLLASIIVLTNMNFGLLLKGLISIIIFYFVFLWRK